MDCAAGARQHIGGRFIRSVAIGIALIPFACGSTSARADMPATQPSDSSDAVQSVMGSSEPLRLDNIPESVYAPPAPPRDDQGTNEGGVHFDLSSRFLDRYLFRGIIRFRNLEGGSSTNFQLDGKLSFDTGRFPHPYVDTFVNVDDGDSVSRFQEVRPSAGFDWKLKPLTLSVSYIDYLFPEREKTNDTQEVAFRIALDDSRLWHTERPMLSPYLFTAYDFERYNGWYFELPKTPKPLLITVYILSKKHLK